MPIKIYKTQTFNKIFLCFETKHKTQTQIFGLHAQPNYKQPHNLKFDNLHTFNPRFEATDLVSLWVLRESHHQFRPSIQGEKVWVFIHGFRDRELGFHFKLNPIHAIIILIHYNNDKQRSLNKIFRDSVQIPTNPQIVDLDSNNIHHKPTNPKINIHHKPVNPGQQNSQPTNPPSEYISQPRSTSLS